MAQEYYPLALLRQSCKDRLDGCDVFRKPCEWQVISAYRGQNDLLCRIASIAKLLAEILEKCRLLPSAGHNDNSWVRHFASTSSKKFLVCQGRCQLKTGLDVESMIRHDIRYPSISFPVPTADTFGMDCCAAANFCYHPRPVTASH